MEPRCDGGSQRPRNGSSHQDVPEIGYSYILPLIQDGIELGYAIDGGSNSNSYVTCLG
jgi:hypothetical protein